MSKVLFTKIISSEKLVEIYEKLIRPLEGKVAVKTHSGEPGGKNFLRPEIMKDLVTKLQGTIVECNTAYKGRRHKSEDHEKVLIEHGFAAIAPVDIMDWSSEIALPVVGGKHLKENYVGKNLQNYDAILMLSHFKGHAMGGFGGALKNMSIGIASREGKAHIHSAGVEKSPDKVWSVDVKQEDFIEAMAEACKSVVDYMKGNIVYINVMNNISIDCDCDANAAAPCMHDIGILASTDPVALDKACLDLIYSSQDEGKKELIERIETLKGEHIIDYAVSLGLGEKEYELISID